MASQDNQDLLSSQLLHLASLPLKSYVNFVSNLDQDTKMSEETYKSKRKLSSLEDAFDGPDEKANERHSKFLQRLRDRLLEFEHNPPPEFDE